MTLPFSVMASYSEAADPRLSKAERGRVVRSMATVTHTGPSGEAVKVSRCTIDRWVRAYYALVASPGCGPAHGASSPAPRSKPWSWPSSCEKRTLFAAGRISPRCLRVAQGWSPHPRTLERHFKALGLSRAALTGANVAYGRFQADYPNELWTGDALHGPVVGGKKAILFAFIDDCSRMVTGHRWSYSEDTLAAQAALRRGVSP